ncbi:TPA: DUF6682 family protein [Photobacterium damselae]
MIDMPALIEALAVALTDEQKRCWTQHELIDYVDAALLAIIARVPQATQYRHTLLVSGQTQAGPFALPADAHQLLSIEAINGHPVRFVEWALLNRMDPHWQQVRGEPQVWTQTKADLTHFWLYPTPQPMTRVTVRYSRILSFRDRLHANHKQIALPEIYRQSLMDYALYLAYQKETVHQQESSKSAQYYQAFQLGMEALSARYA